MRKAQLILLMAVAVVLAGCGYKPLYGSSPGNAGVSTELAAVTIPEAADRTGQLIRNELVSTMKAGTGGNKYALTLKVEEKNPGIIKKTLPAVTRQAVNLNVEYELMERASGNIVTSGKTFSSVSYDVIRQPFADMQAETDATERAALEVATDIRTRLAAYFAKQQPKP